MSGGCKLSVITICYNAAQFIESTFESVRKQQSKCFEYVVIDGDSNDGTKKLIENNQDIIDYWCSEQDNGIADALNKGITRSKGEYIVFLHADDYFLDEHAISRALRSIEKGTDLIAFDIFFESENGRRRGASRGFSFYTNFKMPFYHPGVLCKRSLFEKIGGFDEVFKIAMDYDFLLRAYLHKASYCVEHSVLTVFRNTGISSREDWSSLSQRFKEERNVHYKNCGSKGLRLLYFIWWALYPKYRRFKYILS